ncbi:MAG: hypothetical protein ABW080_10475 [Candidatus Thiodiazotropha sp.]
MIISADALGILIMIATLMVAAAPVILLVLWLMDKKQGRLW